MSDKQAVERARENLTEFLRQVDEESFYDFDNLDVDAIRLILADHEAMKAALGPLPQKQAPDKPDPNYVCCPSCGRGVEIIEGRWSQHTDPKTYQSQEFLQCEMAGRAFLAKEGESHG